MARPVVLVTVRSFGSGSADPARRLREAGLDPREGAIDHDLAALRSTLVRAVAWVAGGAPVTAAHLAAAPGLRVLARYGVGVEAVDLGAARARGVVVTNTPGANAPSVADHTVALLLAVLRRVVEGDRAVRAGDWPVLAGLELGSLTAGIVGYGNVGRLVAARLRDGFGMRVVAADPLVPAARLEADGVEPVTFDQLLAVADAVSLHLPASTGAPLIDAAAVARMRPGAVLVNTARPGLLDEAAVATALHQGYLRAAALDVLAEPASESPLLRAPGVVVTPHSGAQTAQANDRMGMTAVEEVLRVLAGDAPRHPVLPSHAPAGQAGT
jgi:D-3-phosphoglycerate dehydrogenase